MSELAWTFRPIVDMADRVAALALAQEAVEYARLASAERRRVRDHLPVVDSNESSDAEWEAGVYAMLADARAKRLAKSDHA